MIGSIAAEVLADKYLSGSSYPAGLERVPLSGPQAGSTIEPLVLAPDVPGAHCEALRLRMGLMGHAFARIGRREMRRWGR